MLPAEQLELITAAVDGELSAPQRRACRRLLKTSPEARTLYRKLKADRDRLRALPRATPPADLRAKILARIANTTPAPVVTPAKPAPVATPTKPRLPLAPQPVRRTLRSLPAWVPVAVAASVLLCVTAGSFAFFNGQSKPKTDSAKNPWSDALPAGQDAQQSVPSPTATHSARPDPDAVAKIDVSPVPPLPPPRSVVPDPIAIAPEPRDITPDLIGSPTLPPIPPFDIVQVHLPFLRAVAELDRDDTRQEFTDELARGAGDPFRLDLFVRDTARGAEVFQNAAKATGLTVFADAATLEKLKKKQVTSVVIYTESLTAAELTALFAKLCAEDMKFSPRVCDSLHATPVVHSDERELKAILGVDVGLYKRPVGSGIGAGQGDREKPVSASTIDSVTTTLTSPSAKAPDKSAVLLTWQTTHPMIGRTPPGMSVELKKYLEKRGPRKPNVVPTVIVIRPMG